MTFTLHTPDGPQEFTGDAYYVYVQGHLVVVANGQKTTYSTSSWTKIVEDAPDNRVHGP